MSVIEPDQTTPASARPDSYDDCAPVPGSTMAASAERARADALRAMQGLLADLGRMQARGIVAQMHAAAAAAAEHQRAEPTAAQNDEKRHRPGASATVRRAERAHAGALRVAQQVQRDIDRMRVHLPETPSPLIE